MGDEEVMRRADDFARRHGLKLGEQFGYGVHGIVLAAESQSEPGRSAVKVHEQEPAYRRERDVYLRLQEHGVSELRGAHVPQLLGFDDELWVIRMTVVARPYVLDFAGAYLDRPPEFPDETMNEWRRDKEEQFGSKWNEVERILWSLERLGVFLVDISPSNISLIDESS